MLDDLLEGLTHMVVDGVLSSIGRKGWGIVCMVLGILAIGVGFLVSHAIVQIISFGVGAILSILGLVLLVRKSA